MRKFSVAGLMASMAMLSSKVGPKKQLSAKIGEDRNGLFYFDPGSQGVYIPRKHTKKTYGQVRREAKQRKRSKNKR